jgi:hypothetical protein
MSPSALSGGYGVQSQFVPRGTESPSATTDHVRDALDVVVEDEADPEDRPQPAVTVVSTTTPATARPRRRALTPRV